MQDGALTGQGRDGEVACLAIRMLLLKSVGRSTAQHLRDWTELEEAKEVPKTSSRKTKNVPPRTRVGGPRHAMACGGYEKSMTRTLQQVMDLTRDSGARLVYENHASFNMCWTPLPIEHLSMRIIPFIYDPEAPFDR